MNKPLMEDEGVGLIELPAKTYADGLRDGTARAAAICDERAGRCGTGPSAKIAKVAYLTVANAIRREHTK